MASEDVQTNLRLPVDLKDRLVASAAENNRSLSAEVTSRLEASFEPMGASGDFVAYFSRESLRMTEAIDTLKDLLRRSSEMFGLFMGYFREKGMSLTSSEREDLALLQHEITKATKEPDIESLILELESTQLKLHALDERLAQLGAVVDPAEHAKVKALKAQVAALKKEYFSER